MSVDVSGGGEDVWRLGGFCETAWGGGVALEVGEGGGGEQGGEGGDGGVHEVVALFRCGGGWGWKGEWDGGCGVIEV